MAFCSEGTNLLFAVVDFEAVGVSKSIKVQPTLMSAQQQVQYQSVDGSWPDLF